MKKHYYLGLAVASMLLATSCSQEEDFGQQSSGELTTFSVSLDGATNSRAAGEGTNVNELVYEVRNSSDEIVIDETVAMNGSSATVGMALVKGEKYKIIFWAQNDENGVYTTDNLTTIGVDYSNVNSNLDKLDAFYNGFEYTADGKQHRVELRRPFAQLNVGTSTEDWSKAQSLGVTVAKSKVEISAGALATKFNAFSGDASEATTETVTFKSNNVIAETFTVNDATYQSLAMNYLLVPGVQAPDGLGAHAELTGNESVAKTTVDQINVTFYKADDDEIYTLSVPNAPIQRNYRTNIIGNLLSGDTNVFDVVVVPDFDGDNNYSELELVMANGGEITLSEDVTVSSSLVVAAGKEVIINLNGKTITNTSTDETFGVGEAIISYGKLTINGEGTVKANSMAVWARGADNAEITINGGTFIGMAEGLAKGGRSVIYASSGNTINIYGGTFEALTADKTSFADKSGVYAALNIADNNGYINVYGGTFKNFDPSNPGTEPSGWNTAHKNGFVTEGYSSVNLSGEDATTKVYQVVEGENAVATTATDLQTAISKATEPTTIILKDVYNTGGQISVEAGKDITIVGGVSTVEGRSVSADGVSFTGQFKVVGKLTLKDMIIKTPTTVISSEVSQYSKSAIALVNSGDVVCENVTFEMADGISDATAITAWWSTGDGANITVKNCTFNCAGQRPVRSDACVTIENCTFNDPYRYAVQMTSKASTMDASAEAYVNFYNNTINAGTTTDKPVYGVQLEGGTGDNAYGCSNLVINGAGNVINLGSTGKESAMYYCEGGKVDHSSIVWNTEVAPVHANAYEVEGEVYYINNAQGMQWFANEVNVNKNSFNGKTVKLSNDIDLSGIEWTPVGQTGATTFNGVFDGQNYTISNLNVDSSEETNEFYSSGLFGWVESHSEGHGHIKNVRIKGATITGNHNCGALVGYITEVYALVENCHVEKATVSCNYYDEDADGGKAGALIGMATKNGTTVKNCTASNSTVSASKDAGQLVGAGTAAKITGCSVTNVTVSYNGKGTGTNINNSILGREI